MQKKMIYSSSFQQDFLNIATFWCSRGPGGRFRDVTGGGDEGMVNRSFWGGGR